MKLELQNFWTAGEQLQLFGLACLLGIPVGIFSDFCNLITAVCRKVWVQGLMDILFWLCYGCFLLCFCAAYSESVVRVYCAVGNLCGFLLWKLTVSVPCLHWIRNRKRWFQERAAFIKQKLKIVRNAENADSVKENEEKACITEKNDL